MGGVALLAILLLGAVVAVVAISVIQAEAQRAKQRRLREDAEKRYQSQLQCDLAWVDSLSLPTRLNSLGEIERCIDQIESQLSAFDGPTPPDDPGARSIWSLLLPPRTRTLPASRADRRIRPSSPRRRRYRRRRH